VFALLDDLLRQACTTWNAQSLSIRYIDLTFATDTVHVWGGIRRNLHD